MLVGVLLGVAAPASAAGSWTTEEVSHQSAQGAVPVDTDVAGDAVAVWSVDDGSTNQLWGARRPATGSWSTPVALSAGPSSTYPLGVAVLEDGTAYVAASRSGDGGVLLAWPEGGTSPASVTTVSGIGGTGHSIGLWSDPTDGDVVVGDHGPAGLTLHLGTASDAPGDFTSVVDVAEQNVAVAFSAGHDYDLGVLTTQEVWVRHVDGATGAVSRVLQRDAGCGTHTATNLALRLDGSGRGAVAWRCTGNEGTVRAAYLGSAGPGRSITVAQSGPKAFDRLVGPSLAGSPGGKATVLWGLHNRASWSVKGRTRTETTRWSRKSILAGGETSLTGFGVVTAASGAALVRWSTNAAVRGLLRGPGARFDGAAVITTPGNSAMRQALAKDGRAFLTTPGTAGTPLTVAHHAP